MTETGTYEIRKENLPRLRERLERLQRKATKYGLPVPQLEVMREWLMDEIVGEGHMAHSSGRVLPMLTVRITGQSPTLSGGWRLVAVVDHRVVPHETLGWPIYTIPWIADEGVEIPNDYHTEAPWCDHCNTVRDRLETFILVNEAGEYKRVGRVCMKDYTGGVPLHAYAAYLYDLPNLTFDLDDSNYHALYLDTERYLANVVAVMEKWGWRSRTTAREEMHGPPATADEALDNMGRTDHDGLRVKVTEAHREAARTALDWARDTLVEQEDLNEYEYNLVIAASQQATSERRIGLIASLPHSYQRAQVQREIAENSTSTHQGTVGQRLDLTLTVLRRMDIEIASFNGRGTEVLKIHVMNDTDGNVFVWKTTAQKLGEGQTYTLRGTVKEHSDYDGVPQTVLTRCSKIGHEPCGTFDYWFDDAGWHCAACEEAENVRG